MMRRRFWFVVVGVSAILSVMLVVSQPSLLLAAADTSQGAKVLFYTESGTTVAPKTGDRASTASKPRTSPAAQAPTETKATKEPWLGIAYWVEWERPGALPTRIADPSRFVFQSGDRVRFHVMTNMEGYLYVINRGPTGRDMLLFPHVGMADQQNRVEARKEYTVPHRGWIRFDNQPGEEGVLFLLSPKPLTNVLDALPQQPTLSPSASGRLIEAFDRRGAKDLLVETDETPGQQATYAGATLRHAAGDPQEGPVVTYRTKLQHQ